MVIGGRKGKWKKADPQTSPAGISGICSVQQIQVMRLDLSSQLSGDRQTDGISKGIHLMSAGSGILASAAL